MKQSKSTLTRLAAFAGLILTLVITFSEVGDAFGSYFDVRAALLVFAAPLLVMALFAKHEPQPRRMLGRLLGARKSGLFELARELEQETAAARGSYGFTHTARFAEKHADPMVRYAGELFSARFSPSELARLLSQRIAAEDAEWTAMSSTLGFLAKMAPYFGMLATVIGMIKLLENMSDFSRISSSMALAMQGTLYGLFSFTLVYAPLQRLASEGREQRLRRNELIARWFVMIADQTEAAYIERDLRSLTVTGDLLLPVAAPVGVAAPARSLS